MSKSSKEEKSNNSQEKLVSGIKGRVQKDYMA